MTLKLGSRSSKSDQLLSLCHWYIHASLMQFHSLVQQILCVQELVRWHSHWHRCRHQQDQHWNQFVPSLTLVGGQIHPSTHFNNVIVFHSSWTSEEDNGFATKWHSGRVLVASGNSGSDAIWFRSNFNGWGDVFATGDRRRLASFKLFRRAMGVLTDLAGEPKVSLKIRL